MRTQSINNFLADLMVWNIKLHDIHWNVKGLQFVMVHEYTEGQYDKAFKRFDEVAELLRMKGERPYSTMKEYMENSSIEELNKGEYGIEESLEIVLKDMEYMRSEALKIREEASSEDDFPVANHFEGYIEDMNKDIWFLKSILSR